MSNLPQLPPDPKALDVEVYVELRVKLAIADHWKRYRCEVHDDDLALLEAQALEDVLFMYDCVRPAPCASASLLLNIDWNAA